MPVCYADSDKVSLTAIISPIALARLIPVVGTFNLMPLRRRLAFAKRRLLSTAL